MTTDFRCENCGKLLNVKAKPSSEIECPYCKARVVVPAGLTSLSGHQTPGVAGVRSEQPDEPSAEEETLVPENFDAVKEVMGTLMPWIISLFFHVGVLVILAFIMIVTSRKTLNADVVVPEIPISENLGEGKAGEMSTDPTAKSLERAANRWAERDSRIPSANLGQTETIIGITGGGTAGGAGAPLGLSTGGGNKPRFFGLGGDAYHVVYVVDCSGSMATEFDMVRHEMIKSFSKLGSQQSFHVIFFAKDQFTENPARRMVFATNSNKRNALKFVRKTDAGGYGSSPIPALIRAFEVLKRAPGRKKGKLIYLLTDGGFEKGSYTYKGKTADEAVLAWLHDNNKSGEIHINPILYYNWYKEAEKVLRKIAKQNGGKFKFVKPDE